MPEIVLSTLNARYIHAAFGLRYLRANLGDLKEQSKILEFDIKQRPHDIAERLLAENPRIVGLGVYIWNTAPMLELVGILKQARPDLWVVLGGPEVSHEWEQQPLCQLADYVIANYPGVRSIGGVRADPLPDHPSGRAIDIMVADMGLGDAIHADIERQAARFGVVYTMWRVAAHFDHIHVTVS